MTRLLPGTIDSDIHPSVPSIEAAIICDDDDPALFPEFVGVIVFVCRSGRRAMRNYFCISSQIA